MGQEDAAEDEWEWLIDAGADCTPLGPGLGVGEGDLGGGGDEVVLCRQDSIRASCTGERKEE